MKTSITKEEFREKVRRMRKSLMELKKEIPGAVRRQINEQKNAKPRHPSADAW